MTTQERDLLSRTISLLDRMAFGLEALAMLVPDDRQPGIPNTTRESMMPSAIRLAQEARALVDEHRRRVS